MAANRQADFETYRRRYDDYASLRREDGIVEIRLHARGDDTLPLVWDVEAHKQFSHLFYDISRDPDVACVILTGTGDAFIPREAFDDTQLDESNPDGAIPPQAWDEVYSDGRHLHMNLLNIEVPVIAAVNGPALYHSELALFSDIVLCSGNAVFQDAPHFLVNVVPGDGVQTLFQALLNPVRANYFLLTGEKIEAKRALEFGLVNEVLDPAELLPRTWHWARFVAARSPLVRRYTRAVLTQHWKKLLSEQLPLGLALEGLAVGTGWGMTHNRSVRKGVPGHAYNDREG